MKRMTPQQASLALQRQVKKRAHDLLDGFLKSTDAESGMTMLQVVSAHAALGYGFTVGIRVEHPEAKGRVAEDPSLHASVAR